MKTIIRKAPARWTVITLLVASGILLGCGDGHPPVAPVSGVVTFGGNPVETGTITFHQPGGRPAAGALGLGGAYKLTTFEAGDGALLGAHKVVIDAVRVSGGPPPAKSFADEIKQSQMPQTAAGPTVQRLVPENYASQTSTPLEAEVKSEDNVINFHLKK
ncbi:hypothetical protein [Lacipirellula sp.]|uniref:hypothetical protein n=1 Tax=Lacipirellula sp. TaxID=2691419 RepID=UPI003D112E6A